MTFSKVPTFSLCVYCGSRIGEDPAFEQAAMAVGRWIGEQGAELIYGGGKRGLMGIVAQAAQDCGAKVVGVIPESMVVKEWARHECDELIVVQTMHERKNIMAERASMFLALPGGIGTFEEFFECWTWRQLGYHNKPIGLLNTQGYFDALIALIQKSMNCDFMTQEQLKLIQLGSDVHLLLNDLKAELKNATHSSGSVK
jgi:uncharacterized protein (TIGR00730 family)